MRKMRADTGPHKQNHLDFEDLYKEITHDWQHRAELLQARRWRKLSHEIKSTAR